MKSVNFKTSAMICLVAIALGSTACQRTETSNANVAVNTNTTPVNVNANIARDRIDDRDPRARQISRNVGVQR